MTRGRGIAAAWAVAAGLVALAGCAAAQERAADAVGGPGSGPYAQALGASIVRFFESEAAFKASGPSFVLEAPARPGFVVQPGFPLKPRFAEKDGRRTVTVSLPEGTSLYGLGGAPGPFLRNGFTSADPVSCAWVLGVRPDGSGFGVLMDTSYACWADLRDAVLFSTPAPSPAVIVIESATPREVLIALNELTGRAEMPPRWALGLAVGAPGDTAAIRALTDRIRQERIPADSVFLSAPAGEVLPAATLVPDPRNLIAELQERNFRTSVVAMPTIGRVPGATLYESGNAAGVWVRDQGGTPVGLEQPLHVLMPDFTREAVRTWWAGAVGQAADAGVRGFSLMASGAVPDDAVVKADAALGGTGTGRQFARLLPGQWCRATREGFNPDRRNMRPVVTDRSGAVGGQRWAWSNVAGAPDKGHPDPLDTVLSLSLSGQPLVAAGLPIAQENDSRTGMAIGMISLFPRVSSWIRFEGPGPTPVADLAATRAAMERRSRLIPYLYTCCFDAFFGCEPIVRPLFLADPKDAALRGDSSGFLIGSDILVVPRLTPDKPKPSCPLKGTWRKVDWADGPDQPDFPDVYLRPGAILALGPVAQHTGEPLDPLTLVVNLDDSVAATGRLYEDDGDGYAFYRGEARIMTYRAQVTGGALLVRPAGLDGGLPLSRRKVVVRLMTDQGEVTGSGTERGTIRIELPAGFPAPSPAPPHP